MAFFEFLSSIGDLLNATIGKFIKPIGGQGTNDIFPSPRAGVPQNPGASNASAIVLDADGSLRTRASVITTRQNIRDDFTGASLTTALTGTLTFTSGVAAVIGIGTTFTTQVTRDLYIKLNTDPETAWTKVRRVVSDTSLELEQGYLGATGGPAASSSSKWPTTTGAAGSFTVGSSLVNILSGTTNGSQSFISRKLDFASIHVDFVALRISQVLAQQQGFAGLFDSVAAPTQQAAIIFDGTLPNTQVRCRSSFTAAATDIQETVVTLPYGLTTNLTTVNYSIDITPNSVVFSVAGAIVATHAAHTPEQFTVMNLALGIKNTAVPASSTTLTTDMVMARSYDQMDDAANPPDPEIHYLTGSLTTSTTAADQVVVSVVVPAGKVLYVVGFFFSTPSPTTDANPAKIGKNVVTTVPASPGTVDGNILYAFFMNTSSTNLPGMLAMDYGDRPRRLGFAGDTVKMTVTPSATTITLWNATLEYILKDAIVR